VNKYEALLIFKTIFENEGMESTITKVEDILVQHGAKLLRVDKVGRKKLAYEIQKSREGLIAVIGFEAPGASLQPITNVLNITEELVRYVITRNDDMDINKPFIVTPVTGREPRELRPGGGGRRMGGNDRGGPRPGGSRRPREDGEGGQRQEEYADA
jgi:small subunit ribosomal protein S6